ncbi:MAG TPA: c-type cytochrome [Gemmatimonadales bacterium]|nr:c-type cytochrome [Gemmatimonadales bacterium]
MRPSALSSTLRRVLGLGLLLAAVTARGATAQDATNPYRQIPKDTVDQVTYNGWKQFELNCARCHGEFGVGTSFAPALVVSLKEGGTIPTKEAFIQTVCTGRKEKGMPAWCELGLEMDKMEAMYSYLKARADGKIGVGRPAVRQNS